MTRPTSQPPVPVGATEMPVAFVSTKSGCWKSQLARPVASAPLPASSSSVSAAAPLPISRATLVVPMFPEPTFWMSTPLARAMILPKGMPQTKNVARR